MWVTLLAFLTCVRKLSRRYAHAQAVCVLPGAANVPLDINGTVAVPLQDDEAVTPHHRQVSQLLPWHHYMVMANLHLLRYLYGHGQSAPPSIHI